MFFFSLCFISFHREVYCWRLCFLCMSILHHTRGTQGTRQHLPPWPICFIFMQFSANILSNSKLVPPLLGWHLPLPALPPGKSCMHHCSPCMDSWDPWRYIMWPIFCLKLPKLIQQHRTVQSRVEMNPNPKWFTSGGSTNIGRPSPSPWSNFLHFHTVFTKILSNNRLVPLMISAPSANS